MNTSTLWYWMTERQEIYRRRAEGGSWPWTSDPILQEYSFCNVFREQDATTVWIREHIREPFADHPNLWFMLAVARQFNLPDMLQAIMDNGLWPTEKWDADGVLEVMRDRQASGLKRYSGAYMITGRHREVSDGLMSKDEFVCHRSLGRLFRPQPSLESIQAWTLWLSGHVGWGPFLAYEVATDLRHTRILQNAPDIMTWANAGVGAVRGLNRVFGRPVKGSLSEARAVLEMRTLLGMAKENLPDGFPELEIRDIEHSLCECDKYERARTEKNRLTKYVPKLEE